MDHNQFWAIIEAAGRQHSPGTEAQADAVCEALKQMAAAEIIEFEKLYDEFRFRAYTWELWGAAFLLNGGCSDDGFEYFRGWLISQGREIYEQALADPDSLAELVDPECDMYELESLLYASLEAYEAVTGGPMPERIRIFPEVTGTPWDESNVDARYPHLSARLET